MIAQISVRFILG